MSENRIENQYTFTSDDLDLIREHFDCHTDWEKGCFSELKKSIVGFLRDEQNNKCCYCKRDLGFDLKQVDIEHILPKSAYSNFTFHGKNLALSCPGCNTKKSNKPVTNYDYKRYPNGSSKIKIVHAHFDDYYEHIEILNNTVYSPNTSKGSETITICELFRLKEVEANAKKYSKKDPIEQFVEAYRNSNGTSRSELKDIILELIE